MRVALVRGTQLGAWDLPNYAFANGVTTDLFVSRGFAADLGDARGFGVRRLPSPADLRGRLGPRAGGAIDLAAGPLQYLVGLERALDGYDGTVVAVSHDRRFLERFRATRMVELQRSSVYESSALKGR